MVIPDWSAGPRPPRLEISQEVIEAPPALARPLDRLAAAIVDIFIILGPVYVLFSAPLKRWLMTSFLVGAEPDLILMIILSVLLGIVLLVAYQATMHAVFGATLGKRLFDIRVVAMFPSEPPGLRDWCFRSLVWVAEAVCLGLPWLAVFSNSKRRPLHDRVCDTVVVSRMAVGVRPPAAWEKGVVHGVFAVVIAAFVLVTTLEVRGVLGKMKGEQGFLANAGLDVGECDVVSQYEDDDAPDETSGPDEHGRLKMAMSLYAAGLADRSCLEAEVEREVALQIPIGAITYLAQAFIYADDAEVSNAYLDKVCADAAGSVECSMSRLVSSWSDDDWPAVDRILRQAPHGSGYLEVWGVRHFMKQARYGEALSLLDGLLAHRELGEFSLIQRTKALYNTYREPEARAAFAQAEAALPEDEGRDLSAWMCVQQLQNGCEAERDVACRRLARSTGEAADIAAETDFSDTSTALARVLRGECHGEGHVDYLALSENAGSPSWQMFFRANLKRQRRDLAAAAALFTNVISDADAPDLLRIEATRRLAQFASPHQMDHVIALWSGFDSKEAWVKTGNILFSRLAERKSVDLAMQVARDLAAQRSLSPKGLTLFESLSDGESGASAARLPASDGGTPPVRQLLDSLGGEN